MQERDQEDVLTNAFLRLRFPHLSRNGNNTETEEEESSQISDSEGEILDASQPEHLSPDASMFILDQNCPPNQGGDLGMMHEIMTDFADPLPQERKKGPKLKRTSKSDPLAEKKAKFREAMDQVLLQDF